MEQAIKNQLTCVLDFAHQLMIQNLGKLDFEVRTCTVEHDVTSIEICLLDALGKEETGKYRIDAYTFDSWEKIQEKMEYMKNLVIKYGGIGDVYADGEDDKGGEN